MVSARRAMRTTCLLFCLGRSFLDRALVVCRCAVPKVFREALVGAGWNVGRSPVHHAVTATDGTTKVGRSIVKSKTESCA